MIELKSPLTRVSVILLIFFLGIYVCAGDTASHYTDLASQKTCRWDGEMYLKFSVYCRTVARNFSTTSRMAMAKKHATSATWSASIHLQVVGTGKIGDPKSLYLFTDQKG